MVLEIRRCIKSVIFFRVSPCGRRGGGGGFIAVLYGKCAGARVHYIDVTRPFHYGLHEVNDLLLHCA